MHYSLTHTAVFSGLSVSPQSRACPLEAGTPRAQDWPSEETSGCLSAEWLMWVLSL